MNPGNFRLKCQKLYQSQLLLKRFTNGSKALKCDDKLYKRYSVNDLRWLVDLEGLNIESFTKPKIGIRFKYIVLFGAT